MSSAAAANASTSAKSTSHGAKDATPMPAPSSSLAPAGPTSASATVRSQGQIQSVSPAPTAPSASPSSSDAPKPASPKPEEAKKAANSPKQAASPTTAQLSSKPADNRQPPVQASSQPNTPSPPQPTSPFSSPSGLLTQPASQLCKKASDCPSNICISGVCSSPGGFSIVVTSGSNTASTSAIPSVVHGRIQGKHAASATACSDPRCVLDPSQADLNELQGPPKSSPDNTLSSAAISGIVLAILFLVLALLLIVPKIRSKIRSALRARDERKERSGKSGLIKIVEGKVSEKDGGSPDFGNDSASTFQAENDEKKSATLLGSPMMVGIGTTAASFPVLAYAHPSTASSQGYQPYRPNQQQEKRVSNIRRKAVPSVDILPAESRGILNSAGNAQLYGNDSGSGQRQTVTFADSAQQGKGTRPGNSLASNPARETVLAYTIDLESEFEELMDNRGGASPAMTEDNLLSPALSSETLQAFPLFTPASPGSTYSAQTSMVPATSIPQAIPTSLRPGMSRLPSKHRLPPQAHLNALRHNNPASNQHPHIERLPNVQVTPASGVGMHAGITESQWMSPPKNRPAASNLRGQPGNMI